MQRDDECPIDTGEGDPGDAWPEPDDREEEEEED